jgi:hypothetical protein
MARGGRHGSGSLNGTPTGSRSSTPVPMPAPVGPASMRPASLMPARTQSPAVSRDLSALFAELSLLRNTVEVNNREKALLMDMVEHLRADNMTLKEDATHYRLMRDDLSRKVDVLTGVQAHNNAVANQLGPIGSGSPSSFVRSPPTYTRTQLNQLGTTMGRPIPFGGYGIGLGRTPSASSGLANLVPQRSSSPKTNPSEDGRDNERGFTMSGF